ncbi:MAG: SprT-like domain-containing protein [Succinivibrionaceae bacterium]
MYDFKNFIEQKYIYFNNLIFENKLPLLPIKITRGRRILGSFRYTIRSNVMSNFRITISDYYDLPLNVIEDVLIHEMIHFFITFNKIEDSSSHGYYFKEKMKDINLKHKRNISVSHKIPNFIKVNPKYKVK